MSEYKMSHTGAQLDEAISKVLSGYILPEGNIEIAANGEYDVTEFAKAVVNVQGGIPDGYINLADVTLHITQTTGPNFGTFVSTGADISNISIAVGFKPKIFLFLHRGTLTTNATSRTMISSLMLCDDNYEIIQQRTEWVARESTTSVKSTGGQTSGTGFKPTANGVQGVGTMVTAPSGNEYAWMAWG